MNGSFLSPRTNDLPSSEMRTQSRACAVATVNKRTRGARDECRTGFQPVPHSREFSRATNLTNQEDMLLFSAHKNGACAGLNTAQMKSPHQAINWLTIINMMRSAEGI